MSRYYEYKKVPYGTLGRDFLLRIMQGRLKWVDTY